MLYVLSELIVYIYIVTPQILLFVYLLYLDLCILYRVGRFYPCGKNHSGKNRPSQNLLTGQNWPKPNYYARAESCILLVYSQLRFIEPPVNRFIRLIGSKQPGPEVALLSGVDCI